MGIFFVVVVVVTGWCLFVFASIHFGWKPDQLQSQMGLPTFSHPISRRQYRWTNWYALECVHRVCMVSSKTPELEPQHNTELSDSPMSVSPGLSSHLEKGVVIVLILGLLKIEGNDWARLNPLEVASDSHDHHLEVINSCFSHPGIQTFCQLMWLFSSVASLTWLTLPSAAG